MTALSSLRQKALALAVAVVATCFSHGSCYNNPARYLDYGFDYVEEWYEETFYYDDYYYDDYYYYDDCTRCGDDGWGSWFDWF